MEKSGQNGAFLKKFLCSRKWNDPVGDDNESVEKNKKLSDQIHDLQATGG